MLKSIANLTANLETRSRLFIILVEITLVAVVVVLDVLTGYEISFSLFYVIPISFAAWYISQRHAIIASFASAILWLFADWTSGHVYPHPLIPIWNTLIRLSFFIIIALILPALRKSLEREKEFARIDYLTGAANSRLFYALLQAEIDRLQRYGRPFTLVHIDLDNFKAVNDQFGHLTGDKALCTVVDYAKKRLRKTDVIARLGGDEFAFLLPETSQASARVSLKKLQAGLLEEMRRNNWLITFSVGVLTCNMAPANADELVRTVDELTYRVKHGGRNGIEFSAYPDPKRCSMSVHLKSGKVEFLSKHGSNNLVFVKKSDHACDTEAES